MTKYIIRRILQAIPLLILINIFIFLLLKAAGDPFAAQAIEPGVSQADLEWKRRLAGLDDPLPLQFIHWYVGDDWYQRDLRDNDVPDSWGQFDGEPDTVGDKQGILRGDFGESIQTSRPVLQDLLRFFPATLGGGACYEP